MTLPPLIVQRAEYWATSADFDLKTREEVQALLDSNAHGELSDRFYRDLEFGTGGMRGIMGAGTSRINVYNIRRATTAMLRYLREVYPGEQMSIAITYDSRNNSQVFARAAATVLAALGVTVLITQEMRPVPLLSFMVRHFRCHGGICITASHNPPAYNGFKVYWRTGGQLVPPHDAGILRHYEAIQGFAGIPAVDFDAAVRDGLIRVIGPQIDAVYLEKIRLLSLRGRSEPDLRIVYSPLHGTGITLVPQMLAQVGFKDVHIVPEQAKPDGNFPTLKFPNPEDPESLTMALALARKIDADLVLATDPDSDRLGFVVKENDTWVIFNGNQLGCLLHEYFLSSLQRDKLLPAHGVAIKTIVTTELQREICEHYGVACDETLTGFKWICQLVEDYESGAKKPYRKFICGGEESYGFLAGDFVRDKDGIIGCTIAAEMVAHYKGKGKTLSQVLDDIYLRHGVYAESLFTLTLPGQEGDARIKRIMARLRAEPPVKIGTDPILQVTDVLTGEIVRVNGEEREVMERCPLPPSDLLQFGTASGARVSIRPSGTEPKIKVYTSAKVPLTSPSELAHCKQRAQQNASALEKAMVALIETIG